ncbi:RPA-interacting protein B [Bienertia sinuspersici]
MEGKKKQSKQERIPLKTLNHISWKEKLKESCYKRVKEDRTRLLWNFRSPVHQSSTQKEFIKSAFKDIVSAELQKLNQQSGASEVPSSLSKEDDDLWEYDGLHTADRAECEEILLEMQRLFYEDIRLELNQKEAERSIALADEEDEYLAFAVNEYMQLNDGKLADIFPPQNIVLALMAWKEKTWCPVCKKGELQENQHFIYCNLCHLNLNRGDEVNLSLLKDRLAEAHEEHLDRGCRSKPEFCIETVFDLTALYIQCQHCDTFEVVI